MDMLFVCTTLITLFLTQVAAPAGQSTLIDFRNSEQATGWSAVNDGVMGGRSVGKLRRSDENGMNFSGTLSLENNGGFASIRSGRMDIQMGPEDGFRVKLKGDGRTYIFNLYPKTRRMAFSYRASLPTVAGKWTEVVIPLEDFTPTSFGRRVQNKGPLSPDQISGIGFMLSDKKAGAFNLEIESVNIEQSLVDDSQ